MPEETKQRLLETFLSINPNGLLELREELWRRLFSCASWRRRCPCSEPRPEKEIRHSDRGIVNRGLPNGSSAILTEQGIQSSTSLIPGFWVALYFELARVNCATIFRLPDKGDGLFVAVDYSPLGEVIRGHLNRNTIPREYLDVVYPHLAGEPAGDLKAAIKGYPEGSVGENLLYRSLKPDYIFL